MSLLAAGAAIYVANQQKHEERLAWLRGLKTGDVVLLTWHDSEHVAGGPRKDRRTVTRHPGNGALYVDDHSRRDVRSGKWERGGQNWLQLRIDPVTP